MATEYVLEMQNITKQYGENTVLSDVSMAVKPGEIHALLGENGAGKSTLMNILFGMPVIHNTGGFEGKVLLDGDDANILSPYDAMIKGIGMVHQEFMLLPGFTITENIKLNREITKPNFFSRILGKNLETLNMKSMSADARKALDSVGMNIDEFTRVQGLPVGYMQFVEIAREIDKTGVKLLVFDEPTAVLTESEATQLISVMKQIAESGIAVIFITHRLDEVMAASDSITILRDGRLAATRRTSETNIVELAELMIGRKGESVIDLEKRSVPHDTVALHIKDLNVDMPGEHVVGLTLDVYEGEILGIGGLAGQGKLGIPNGVMGLYDSEGEVELFGQPLKIGDTDAALRAGIAMVSEDRKGVGLLLDQSIEDNIVFNAMQIHGEYLHKLGPFTLKNSSDIRGIAEQMITDLDIRCFGPTQYAGTLSGGNQQKVCIARALCMSPKFLFVSEPTRGIDIGAKKLVLETLVKLNRDNGMTIVIVSSELQELRSISDRIAIVSEGRLVDILPPEAPDADFGLAMSGIKPQDHNEKGAAGHDE
ncbi:MAG: sugar ABC transporter ATP-binding protein [Clostridia bacterium]|nr:sugar ABC transporter ATP-binding protein [Clostridia bacterium]